MMTIHHDSIPVHEEAEEKMEDEGELREKKRTDDFLKDQQLNRANWISLLLLAALMAALFTIVALSIAVVRLSQLSNSGDAAPCYCTWETSESVTPTNATTTTGNIFRRQAFQEDIPVDVAPAAADHPSTSWQSVYANRADGSRENGSIDALTSALLHGADVKVKFTSGSDDDFMGFFPCDYTYFNDSYVVCMNTQQISVKSVYPGHDFGFQDNAYHWFVMINTNGERHMSRWYVGDHSGPSGATTRDTKGYEWFVKNHDSSASNPTTNSTVPVSPDNVDVVSTTTARTFAPP